MFLQFIPFSIAGFGVRDIALSSLLPFYQVPPEEVLAIAFIGLVSELIFQAFKFYKNDD